MANSCEAVALSLVVSTVAMRELDPTPATRFNKQAKRTPARKVARGWARVVVEVGLDPLPSGNRVTYLQFYCMWVLFLDWRRLCQGSPSIVDGPQ